MFNCKITKRVQVVLVKALIAVAGIWLLLTIYVGVCYEYGFHPEWSHLFLSMCFVLIALGILLMVFMSRIDISPSAVLPQIYSLRKKAPTEIKENLLQASNSLGFGETIVTSLSNESEIITGFKSQKKTIHVFQIIWVSEFSVEILNQATHIFWEAVERKCEKGTENTSVGLIQCVCFEKINSAFRTFVKRNTQQGYKRYQILCGLSLSGRRLYVRRSTGNFFRPYYRSLERLLREITKDIVLS